MKYKISVIIPIYNTEEYVEQCLYSITNQILNEIEIICIDDGSTDNSKNIIKELSKKDNRIKYFSMGKNFGSGPARNKGLEIATGEYISFIDSDDFIIDNTAYEDLYEYASQNNADIISANLKNYNAEKNTFHKNFFCREIEDNSPILPQNYGIPWYYQKNLFKRSFLVENKIKFPDYKRGQDPVFLTNVLVNVDLIHCLPIDFYAYRNSPPNKITSEKKELDYIKHFSDVLDLLEAYKFEKMYLEYEERMYAFFIRQKSDFLSKSLEKNIKEVFGENSRVIEIYNSKILLEQLLDKINRLKSTNNKLNAKIKKIEFESREEKNRLLNKINGLESTNNKLNAKIRKMAKHLTAYGYIKYKLKNIAIRIKNRLKTRINKYIGLLP